MESKLQMSLVNDANIYLQLPGSPEYLESEQGI